MAQTTTNIGITSALAVPSKVTFTTEPFWTYQVEMSDDLDDWDDLGGFWYGDGTEGSATFDVDMEKMFYRVRETAGSFMTQPVEGQQINRIGEKPAGVAFAFNMNGFITQPTKIRIYQRPWNTNATWIQIGKITDFTERDGLHSVRGSVVWLAPALGQYEVKAEAVASNGTILVSNQRRIVIGQHALPTITITGGPPVSSTGPVDAIFTVETTPPGAVSRVEFYDEGVLIATDTKEPFGDELLNGRRVQYELSKGIHKITAKAYDNRSAVGMTAAPDFTVNVTGGIIRPSLSISTPVGGTTITRGASFSIPYTTVFPNPDSTTPSVTAEVQSRYSEGADYDATAFFGSSLTLSTANWPLGTHQIVVLAEDDYAQSYYRYLTVFVQDATNAGLAVSYGTEMADTSSVTLSNQQFFGVTVSSQFFTNGINHGLQMDTGVLFTTGVGADWDDGDLGGPVFSDERTTIWSAPGDSRLQNLLGANSSAEAAGWEASVQCNNGQLELEYQFASEEYDKYINRHNDAFLVTVDGVVVSLTPDSFEIAGVKSINLNANRDLFLGDDEDIDPTDTRALQVDYDGTTIRLKMHVLVTSGSTYPLRMVVVDINDGEYDSGLFIERDTLRSVPVAP